MALPPVRSVDALASGNGVLVAVLSEKKLGRFRKPPCRTARSER
jgi:hypothetical protein